MVDDKNTEYLVITDARPKYDNQVRSKNDNHVNAGP